MEGAQEDTSQVGAGHCQGRLCRARLQEASRDTSRNQAKQDQRVCVEGLLSGEGH